MSKPMNQNEAGLAKAVRDMVEHNGHTHQHITDLEIVEAIREFETKFKGVVDDLPSPFSGSMAMGYALRAVIEADPNRKQVSFSN